MSGHGGFPCGFHLRSSVHMSVKREEAWSEKLNVTSHPPRQPPARGGSAAGPRDEREREQRRGARFGRGSERGQKRARSERILGRIERALPTGVLCARSGHCRALDSPAEHRSAACMLKSDRAGWAGCTRPKSCLGGFELQPSCSACFCQLRYKAFWAAGGFLLTPCRYCWMASVLSCCVCRRLDAGSLSR